MTKFDQAIAILSGVKDFDRDAVDRHVRLYDSAQGEEQQAIGRTLEAWFQVAKTAADRAWLTERLNQP